MNCTEFLVQRDDFSKVECRKRELPDPANGEVLLQITRFAFTANNITYAAFGDAMRYWEFFPSPAGTGIIPVWGFGDVVASNCEGVEVGQRYYGYYPMATYVVLQPAQINAAGFFDSAPRRLELADIYNHYAACATDPSYKAGKEAQQMLFRPLFTTAFLLDDLFADQAFYGARTLYLTSASSKTALGMAQLLHHNRAGRETSYEIVGLTSDGNKAFVESLGCYDTVVSYSQIADLPEGAAAIVDFAGDATLLRQLHERLAPGLQHTCMVGAAHWSADSGSALGADLQGMPGPAPEFFFAPSQAEKRVSEWGLETFQGRLAESWIGFMAFVDTWLTVEEHLGEESSGRIYQDVLAGRSDPKVGYVLSLQET